MDKEQRIIRDGNREHVNYIIDHNRKLRDSKIKNIGDRQDRVLREGMSYLRGKKVSKAEAEHIFKRINSSLK